jgi:hypothetical protein
MELPKFAVRRSSLARAVLRARESFSERELWGGVELAT